MILIYVLLFLPWALIDIVRRSYPPSAPRGRSFYPGARELFILYHDAPFLSTLSLNIAPVLFHTALLITC